MHRLRTRRAFTLIELLVVIVILGILMAVALPTYLRQQSKANDSNAKQQLTYAYRAIRSALPEFNNAYPSVASVVSTIQQSEPELAVASGGCNGATTDKQVEVDPVLTTGSKLALYTKSSSGTWFRLSASPSGAQTFTQLGTCQGALTSGTLSSSANAITDETRAADVQGDGLTNDSSFGAWDSTTNQLANGGFETGSSGWTHTGINTTPLSQDSTIAKFGSSSMRVGPTPNLGAGEGITTTVSASPTAASGQTWTGSAWVRGSAGGETLTPILQATDNGGMQTEGATGSSVTLTGQWQRVAVTLTTANASTTHVRLRLVTTTQQTATFYVDGVQLEQLPLATPYVDTNGAAASRSVASVTIPSSLLNPTQGWFAIRFKPEWPSSSPPGGGTGFDRLMAWSASVTDKLDVYWYEIGGRWAFERNNGDQSGNLLMPTSSFSAGTPFTIIVAWTASQTKMSVNGASFVTANRSEIPTGLPATVCVASACGGGSLDGEVYWAATGTGVLTDTDAQTITGWGSNDPTSQDFPAAAQATMAWSADNATYVTGN